MDTWIDEYISGDSLPTIASRHSAPISRVRVFLIRNGIELRSRADGMRASIPTRKQNPHRTYTDAGKAAIAESRRKWGEENALGISQKASGFVEFTVGEEKGKSVHVQLMEDRLGRKLLPDETVHHIDRDRSNNNLDNLALVTRAAHARLHRFEDGLEGKIRERSDDGRFS